MRWLVEVTTSGKSLKQRYTVEADSWQRALLATRTLRGDGGTMSGFSIELLESGCRAVDPGTRTRFEVTRAADDAPLTDPSDANGEAVPRSVPPSKAPSAMPPRPGKDPTPKPASVAPAAPKSKSAGKTPSPPKSAPAGKTPSPPKSKPATSGTPPKAPAGITPKPPSVAPPPPSSPAPSSGVAPSPPAAPAIVAAPIVNASGPPPSQRPPYPYSQPPPPVRELPPLSATTEATLRDVPAQIIFRREEEPSDLSPLTYREYVYAVTPGTDEHTAVAVLRAQFEIIERSLTNVRPGKLVNLAVFDVVFQGKPPGAPLATLLWKDWRGPPVVTLPRRPDAELPSPSMRPPPPHSIPPSAQVEPVLTGSMGASAMPLSHQPPPIQFPVGLKSPGVPLDLVPTAPPPPPAMTAPAPPPNETNSPVPIPLVQPPAPAPFPLVQPASNAPRTVDVKVVAAPVFTPPAGPVVPNAPPSAGRMDSRASFGKRGAAGDELIADLFDAMHALHFLRDAIEGAHYCLSLALEMVPSRAGIAHFFNINKREFIVAATEGGKADSLVLRKHPATDPILAAALKKKSSLVIADATDSEARGLPRFEVVGIATSLIASPILLAGRPLGVFEIANPIDGIPFSEAEGNALAYIATQYAEFISTRGLVLDSESISRLSVAKRR